MLIRGKTKQSVALVVALLLLSTSIPAHCRWFGERFCNNPNFHCRTIKVGENWETLWPDFKQRRLIQRLNRMNAPLLPGTLLAVPTDLQNTSLKRFSPMPNYFYQENNRTFILVNLAEQAWGAYDFRGHLRRWGPLSSGQSICSAGNGFCQTRSGIFFIKRAKGAACATGAKPKGSCGVPNAPDCIYYGPLGEGFSAAMYGSDELPGFPASQGCILLFPEDSQWLRNEFLVVPGTTRPVRHTTRVVVRGSL